MMSGAGVMKDISDFFGMAHGDIVGSDSELLEINLVEEHELMSFKKAMRLRARLLILSAILMFLIYVYLQKNYGADAD